MMANFDPKIGEEKSRLQLTKADQPQPLQLQQQKKTTYFNLALFSTDSSR